MRYHLFLANIFSIIVFASCDKEVLTSDPMMREVGGASVVIGENASEFFPETVDYPVVPEGHPALVCMRNKAHQIADIEWIPLNDIPGLTKPIPAGIMRTGIPYSSVKEKDKFVGLEVSFHTFMTALHNPRSVLYTEDVKEPPYHGVNCGPYYGTVCSGAVNYALGINRPYESSMYKDVSYIARVKNQSPESIYPGDILWSQGHVVLVLDVHKDDAGYPVSFDILESAGRTSIKAMSLVSFCKRWETDGWIAYRNMRLAENVSYTPIPYIVNDGDQAGLNAVYNDDLCTSRGDKVSYVEGEDIMINVLSDKYKSLEVFRDGIMIKSLPLTAKDIVLHSLEAGSYMAHLCSDNMTSKDVCFEIINETTNVVKHGGKYVVSFGSANSIPLYLVVCSWTGARSMIVDITKHDLNAGGIILQGNFRGQYLKVFYQGKYGRVSNSPIKL